MSGKKEVCDRGMLGRRRRAGGRRGEADGGMKGRMEEEEEAGAFIKCSGQRRADNSALSIRFNPLKDLNVHLL